MRSRFPLLASLFVLVSCGSSSTGDEFITDGNAGGAAGAAGSAGQTSPAGGSSTAGTSGAGQGGSAPAGGGGAAGQPAGGHGGGSAGGGQAGQGQAGGGTAGQAQAGGGTAGGQGGSAQAGSGQSGSGQSGSSNGGQAGNASAGSGQAGQGQAGQGQAGSGQAGSGGGGAGSGQAGEGGAGSPGGGTGGVGGGAAGNAGSPGGGAGAGGSGQGGQGGGVTFPPSTANVGWVGGACKTAADCQIEGAICLTDGFPNGSCTAPCDLYCPDRNEPTDTTTFCVDGRPFSYDQGLCSSTCDPALFPGTGCAAGYECVERNRYSDPQVTKKVCMPITPASSCAGGEDEIIPVTYPDAGALWVPAEAQCGGSFDLVVMLHGINPDHTVAPSLGGGRRLELETRALIDGGRLRPVILAEPVHFQGSSTLLYGPGFNLTTHLDLLVTQLKKKGISIASLSYTGHSGAGCDESNGLYKVLAKKASLIPAYAPSMPLMGLEDICYESAYHWQAIESSLTAATAMVNMYTIQGNPDAFEANLFPTPAPLDCSPDLYGSCIRRTDRPWCSYRTLSSAGIVHDNNPYFFVREVFPRVFPPGMSANPCPAG